MTDNEQKKSHTFSDPETARSAGGKGGTALVAKYGSEYMAKLGKAGGEKTKARGVEYYREIRKLVGKGKKKPVTE